MFPPGQTRRWPLPFLRATLLMVLGLTGRVGPALAQEPQFLFTVAPPEVNVLRPTVRASAAVEERALQLWSGADSDFGIASALSTPRWTVRSVTSLRSPSVSSQPRPTFQQVEIIRGAFSDGSRSLAFGGGIRQEWSGTQVLIGRVLAGSDFLNGRLQGSLVMERASSSPSKHDAADLVTTAGWLRSSTGPISVGLESIGQDLEGFWDPAERDGGAKLLIGPSLHIQSHDGVWLANLTAGPVIRSKPATVPSDVSSAANPVGRSLGVFVSGSWTPSSRR